MGERGARIGWSGWQRWREVESGPMLLKEVWPGEVECEWAHHIVVVGVEEVEHLVITQHRDVILRGRVRRTSQAAKHCLM